MLLLDRNHARANVIRTSIIAATRVTCFLLCHCFRMTHRRSIMTRGMCAYARKHIFYCGNYFRMNHSIRKLTVQCNGKEFCMASTGQTGVRASMAQPSIFD